MHDLIERDGLHARLLQMRERLAGVERLMLPAVPHQQNPVAWMQTRVTNACICFVDGSEVYRAHRATPLRCSPSDHGQMHRQHGAFDHSLARLLRCRDFGARPF